MLNSFLLTPYYIYRIGYAIRLDTYKEILDTITRNKSRSLLTGFGVFWGVFMLIALMGGGQGLKEMLQNNFTGFATNTAIIWAQNTTKPYVYLRFPQLL